MAKATMRQLRKALSDALAGIPTLNESAYVPTNPQVPAVWVMPGAIEYDATMGRGHDQVYFTIQVLGRSVDEGTQRQVDRMLDAEGESSIKECLERDTTLAGLCDDLRVERTSGYRLVNRAGGPAIIIEWEVLLLV